jgi:hypothetical protein
MVIRWQAIIKKGPVVNRSLFVIHHVYEEGKLKPYRLSLPDSDIAYIDVFLCHVNRAELLRHVSRLLDQ